MRLQHNSTPNLTLGYFVVSVPLSSICHVAAMVMAILGAVRFLRVQNSMARGYAVAGGWEIKVAGTMATLVSNDVRCIARTFNSFWLGPSLHVYPYIVHCYRQRIIVHHLVSGRHHPDSSNVTWFRLLSTPPPTSQSSGYSSAYLQSMMISRRVHVARQLDPYVHI